MNLIRSSVVRNVNYSNRYLKLNKKNNQSSTLEFSFTLTLYHIGSVGAQRLSGRVLDSRPRGYGFDLTDVTALCF